VTTAARPAGAVAVLGDGLTVAAGSSKLLRGPSIYIGLLTLALAGPGVISQLWVLSWSEAVGIFSLEASDASQMVGFAGILVGLALLGIVVVSIEGGAIGAMLIAGRVLGRPVTLRLALERSRVVFWRLVRAALVVGLIEILASLAWRAVTNAPAVFGDIPNLSVEPIPGAIVSLPFIYSSVAIVVADDGARASLRRSARLARQRKRLAFALAAFALLSGVLEALALGSGVDLIVRLAEVLHLDVTAGGASLVLAMALGLLIATAVGSLVFTVAALVSAPQIVAWDRLGLPTTGLPAAEATEPEVAEAAEAEVTEPEVAVATEAAVTEPELADGEATKFEGGQAPAPDQAPATGQAPGPAGSEALAPEAPTPESAAAPASLAEPPPAAAWGAPPVPTPTAWAIAAATPPRFRWVTVPMRLTIGALWLIVIAMFIGGPPV